MPLSLIRTVPRGNSILSVVLALIEELNGYVAVAGIVTDFYMVSKTYVRFIASVHTLTL